MIDIKRYLSQHTSTQASGTRAHLLMGKHTSPLVLMKTLQELGRKTQFIGLDDLSTEYDSRLPGALDNFLDSGYDVVLTIGSIEVLNKYLDVLVQWKFENEGKRGLVAPDIQSGSLYLLIDHIPRSMYPPKLQRLIDFEYQEPISTNL